MELDTPWMDLCHALKTVRLDHQKKEPLVVYCFGFSWQIGGSFCPGHTERKCSIHAESVAVTPEASICRSMPCPSETRADYHNGLWKLHMEQCFSRNKSWGGGGCNSTAGPFISLDKACLMPLNVLLGIKKGGHNGNLLTPVLWYYRLAHIVAPWEQD